MRNGITFQIRRLKRTYSYFRPFRDRAKGNCEKIAGDKGKGAVGAGTNPAKRGRGSTFQISSSRATPSTRSTKLPPPGTTTSAKIQQPKHTVPPSNATAGRRNTTPPSLSATPPRRPHGGLLPLPDRPSTHPPKRSTLEKKLPHTRPLRRPSGGQQGGLPLPPAPRPAPSTSTPTGIDLPASGCVGRERLGGARRWEKK